MSRAEAAGDQRLIAGKVSRHLSPLSLYGFHIFSVDIPSGFSNVAVDGRVRDNI